MPVKTVAAPCKVCNIQVEPYNPDRREKDGHVYHVGCLRAKPKPIVRLVALTQFSTHYVQ